MTETSLRRHPFWQVQAVFDPDGGGGDFAYTIGLAAEGVPELHLWGRPALGEDPGEDWKLSCRDMCWILNELAWSWLAGELRIGDSVEREYDDGLVTVRFRVDPPQDSESLEAYGAHESPVVPIRWSLHRPAIGPARGMTSEQETLAGETWAGVVSSLDLARTAPPGWELPARPTWELQQRWGPRTPLVLARAAQLWQADSEQLANLVRTALAVERAGSLSWPCSVAGTASRPVGRHRRLEKLHGDVSRLMEGFGVRWSRVASAAMQREVLGPDWSGPARRRDRANLRDLVECSLLSALAVEAVADVLPARTLVHGLGPLLSGLGPPGMAPDSRWLASPSAISVIQELLSPVGTEGLASLALAHDRALGDPEYGEVFDWLIGRAATGPACCGEVVELVHPGRAVWLAIALVERRVSLGTLQAWATALTALLVHRLELSDEWCRRFLAPVAQLLPSAAEVLNKPVVAEQ